MKKILIAALTALVLGTFLGSRFLAVPLRTFSVDSQGNQHCAGLRHGEKFEVFCLSTERPWGESAPRDVDRELYPPPPGYRQNVSQYLVRRPVPAAEDHRAPWRRP
jgi:hypothetical protein